MDDSIDLVEKNIKYLKTYDLKKMALSLTVEEIDGKIMGYLNLFVNPKTGEILDLSFRVRVQEEAISIPIAIEIKNILEDCKVFLHVESSLKRELSKKAYEVVERSFHGFNQNR